MACTPNEDSNQPGHLPSLIRVFTVRMKKAWVLSYPLSAQRRLWSDWADAQADMSLRWAHMPLCWFCHETAHLLIPPSWSVSAITYMYYMYVPKNMKQKYYVSIKYKIKSIIKTYTPLPIQIKDAQIDSSILCLAYIFSSNEYITPTLAMQQTKISKAVSAFYHDFRWLLFISSRLI